MIERTADIVPSLGIATQGQQSRDRQGADIRISKPELPHSPQRDCRQNASLRCSANHCMNSRRAAAVLIASLMVNAAGAQTYVFEDLGTLPGFEHSLASGINDSGSIVGHATNDLSFGPDRAFLWQAGSMADLGTLEGDSSVAYAINNSGSIVGQSDAGTEFNPPSHAFLWNDNTMTDLGTLGGSHSWAIGLSLDAQVGGARLGPDSFHATQWSTDEIHDLGVLPGHCCSSARAVNATGQIVGYSTTTFAQSRAVLWDQGAMQSLGTLPGGCCSEASDINDDGSIVGFSWLDGTSAYHAFLWIDGTMTDLGTLPGATRSRAHAINQDGDIVGVSWTTANPPTQQHATLWRDGQIIDLNDALDEPVPWTLTVANDINNVGQIVGVAVDPIANQTHAFLLTPVPSPPGDADADGDVDLDDYAAFLDCAAGPQSLPDPKSTNLQVCLDAFDRDADLDVDFDDFAALQQSFQPSP